MARQEHVDVVTQGAEAIRQWKERIYAKNRSWGRQDALLDLKGADLEELDLAGADLGGADLEGASLEGSNLEKANLQNSQLMRADLAACNLRGALLNNSDAHSAIIADADLRGAYLFADFHNVAFNRSDFRGAHLRETCFEEACLSSANLSEVDLTEAHLSFADLSDANLKGANLTKADLSFATLCRTDLRDATLSKANLGMAVFVDTLVQGAKFIDCNVYGVSAWDMKGDPSTQRDLVITKEEDAAITVDSLEVAQFVYLLLSNHRIRNVIHTVTSRAVLILGRFTADRKPVLDWIRNTLKEHHNLVPILFDFEPSDHRDLTETIQLLANMCRFVIADVTDAKSIPQELSAIIPHFPSVAIQPIILSSQRPYAMFEHWRGYNNVLPEHEYNDFEHLKATLQTNVLTPIENWENATNKAEARNEELRKQIEEKNNEIAELRARLRES